MVLFTYVVSNMWLSIIVQQYIGYYFKNNDIRVGLTK